VKQFKLFLILFCFFILQETVFQIFTPQWFGYNFQAIPHLVLIAICFVGLFFSRSIGLQYAVLFGLLLDMTSSNILGVYAFCIGITTYLLSMLARWIQLNLIVVLLLMLVAVTMVEIEVYGIYSLLHKVNMSFQTLLVWRLPPTLILNGCFTILLFYPFRRFLLQLVPDQPEE
jgi:rod shape-determining protein MreD